MKKTTKKIICFFCMMSVGLAGCSTTSNEPQENTSNTTSGNVEQNATINQQPFVPELTIRFGRDQAPFIMNLYDNETARAIYSYVGTSQWNLPIYHYDDYENYEVMQYYDIPSRYQIPSNPETITSQKAGEVYYSQPNRIILFYRDANLEGEYTKLGTFDANDEFVNAVIENPVVEGYSNKIISIDTKE